MSKLRVLVVDDSVVVRRIVSLVLGEEPLIEVVGVAANGRIALSKIPQVNPDLLTLDIEMPEMGGLETISAIRKTWPRLPIVVFSALTERGAAVTFDALTRGATDYVTKPAFMENPGAACQWVRDLLLPKIKAFICEDSRLRAARAAEVSCRPSGALPAPPASRQSRVEIIAIGASTGGPNALAEMMSAFPPDLPVPVVIVQHMPPMLTRLLAERLSSKTALTVREGEQGAPLLPGMAWVAPGGFHMLIRRTGLEYHLDLNRDPPENSCRPAVDVLFRSVAEVYGQGSLGIVLTGIGQDGMRGCERIRQAMGQVLAQDEQSSVIWGMPGAVAKAGLADRVMPLQEIGNEAMARVLRFRKPSLSGLKP